MGVLMLLAVLFLKGGRSAARSAIFYARAVRAAHVLGRPHRVPHRPEAGRRAGGREEELSARRVVVALAGPRREEQQDPRAALARERVPLVRLEAEERRRRRRLTASPPQVDVAPCRRRTVTHAFSFTWCSPSSWPGCSTISTARRAVVRVQDDGSRVPFGASSVSRSQRCTAEAYPAWLHSTRSPMPLVVDSFVLGPYQSNCYVVRPSAARPRRR